jgi:MoaA/NifB/PqqE/SkfB family radical SAM enzyme
MILNINLPANLFYHFRLLLAAVSGFENILPSSILPALANINLTERCNARCITCDYWKTKHKDNITTQRAINLLNEMAEMKIRYLRLEGGEPLLRQDLFEILSFANGTRFNKVVLATNGLLLKKYAGKINDSIITNITVSLDSIGENNDIIRGIKGYYDKVISNLKYIQKKIKIVSTLNKLLIDNLEEMILWCNNNGYEYDINIPDNNMYFLASKDVKVALQKLKLNNEEIYKTFELLNNYDIIKGVISDNAKAYMISGKFIFRHCTQGYIEVNIDSLGNVRSGCNVFKSIGNILNNSLEEIINSDDYLRSAKKMFSLDCPGCTCGYGISAIYANPISAWRYIQRRLA